MVAVVRALRIMRLGNAVRNGALIFKILLNFSGAALIIVTGAKLPTAYRAVALGMIFLQFLNPVALAIYFTPPQATSGLKSLSATFALVMMPLLLWYLAIDAGVADQAASNLSRSVSFSLTAIAPLPIRPRR